MQSLVEMEIYKNSDDKMQTMTFTELQDIYLQYKETIKIQREPSTG
ncbi:hypothetical protein [Bacillus sp. V3B]